MLLVFLWRFILKKKKNRIKRANGTFFKFFLLQFKFCYLKFQYTVVRTYFIIEFYELLLNFMRFYVFLTVFYFLIFFLFIFIFLKVFTCKLGWNFDWSWKHKKMLFLEI